ncbi:MAG: DUF2231 domain-containing protein [bacterium]|nr:DUF2231 domain-containing protein [bacterium]
MDKPYVRSNGSSTRQIPSGTQLSEHEEIPSVAAIAGHPIHPMLIPFPIASLSGALLSDIVHLLTDEPFWGQASFVLLGVGIASGLVAGIAGAVDYFGIEKVRSFAAARVHVIGNVTVLALSTINFLLRFNQTAEVPMPWGLVLSLVSGILLVVTGWMGGELSYRHKVGVNSKG